ncbi:uncharacterized protein LOC105425925 [Pogonomyrmex barbatus]|uniref:Uncharacterized protein LOC105425925 n=1 Tax=Pogonomyrmex barbatus TaxID=144034 RepID=A0A6I9W557_9HYME|nr:uncharacterized protein LOC105425925 [Pogonomyrmex barbatus]
MDDTRARVDEDIALDSSRLRSSTRLGSAASIAAAAAAAAAAVTATAATVSTTTTSTTSSTTAATCRVPRRKRKKRRRQRLATSNDDVVTSRSATSSNNAAVAEGTDAVVVLESDADAVDAAAGAAANAATAETDPPAARVDKLRSRLLGEQNTAASGEAQQQLRVGGSGSRAAASSVGTAGVTLLNRRAGKRSPRRCNAAGGRRSAMTMDLQRLINEVHARPAIWDQKNVNYHNRDVILKMWREIARACEVSTDVAKSKWKHLRDNFRNELKKTYRGKCDGVGTEHDSKWVWFKSLFFLRDQMNSRVIGCALSQNCVGATVNMRSSPDGTQIEPQIDILEGHEETQFDDLDGDSCQSLLSNDDGLHQVMPPPKMNKIIGRKRALMDAIDNDYGVEVDRERYESLQKRLAIGPEDEDDTYHFLMSVRNPLRSLPLDRQMFVRLKIQELVYNEINSQNQQQQQTTSRGAYDASSQNQDVKPPRTGNGGNGVADVVSDMSNPASLLQNCTPEGSGDDAFFG